MKRQNKTLITSAIIWISGFILAFIISPGSKQIWLPDALLLLGFLPLLINCKPGWPWILYGTLNMLIGFVLLVVRNIPESVLPAQMIMTHHHLINYHVPGVWMLIGLIATVYGAIKMLVNGIKWFCKFLKQRSEKN